MKLFFATPSPYARKVRVLAAEKGLQQQLEVVACAPFDRPADLIEHNPLSKVPALITDDGLAIYDSPVICEYLDQLASPRFIPATGDARWVALRRQALADGLLDAGILVLLEGRRVETERSPGWVARQTDVVNRTLDAFESEIPQFSSELTIAHIALGCALGWLDFRMPDLGWTRARPKLAAWNEQFQMRPSMQSTRPS